MQIRDGPDDISSYKDEVQVKTRRMKLVSTQLENTSSSQRVGPLLFSERSVTLLAPVQGGRRKGIPERKRLEDSITESIGVKLDEALRTAENRRME